MLGHAPEDPSILTPFWRYSSTGQDSSRYPARPRRLMLFNSLTFLFVFLPVTALVYFRLAPRSWVAARSWLLLASFVFYGWWKPAYVILLAGSIAANYWIGRRLSHDRSRRLLTLGVALNLGLLALFKYLDFAISNLNAVLGSHWLFEIALPLAISFFTFQQIAFLVDVYRNEAAEPRFGSYALFVAFFPQLIAGPIVHHSETIPQFRSPERRRFSLPTCTSGLLLLTIGLFKKVVIADTFAVWANIGFGTTEALGALQSWSASLAYTFQLYFDFSGYTDMALGAALIFNIRLPVNFDSPYQATSIQDFWRRWHMTLSRWLRDYLYFPLGGNRRGRLRSHANLMIVMTLGGLWHGAAWTFVLWGVFHGLGLVVHRLWSLAGLRMPALPARMLTFVFVTAAFVIFRAEDLETAGRIFAGMLGTNGLGLAELSTSWGLGALRSEAAALCSPAAVAWTLAFGLCAMTMPNSNALCGIGAHEGHARVSPGMISGIAAGVLLGSALLRMSAIDATEFLYFNF